MKVIIFRKIVALGALLFWTTTPGMACLLPGGQLAEEHSECCRSMDGECDQMPFSESCCDTVVQVSHVSLPVEAVIAAPDLDCAWLPAVVATAPASSHPLHAGESASHSPPVTTPELRSILRV